MKLSFSTLACADWSLEEIGRAAAQWGYDGVELRLAEPHISTEFSKEQRAGVKEAVSRSGLDICCLAAYTRFHSPDAGTRAENVDNLKRAIVLASDLGSPYVRSFGGDPSSEESIEQVTRWISDAFAEVDSYAGEHGVKVLLETHDILSKGQHVRRVFDHNVLNNAGVLWDVKHSLVHGETLEETMEFLRGRIEHIHVKDWIELPEPRGEHLILQGAGQMPTLDVVEKLAAIGYKGYLSLEWEKLWHPEIEDSTVAVYQYAWYMHRLLQQAGLR